ncbi:DivIVA domain-containing protein [Amycolatopsis sp. NBC_00355]|uniref:DivIVA domain-containing protein n=1 Tax=Amycolatopsis sp. NBC_00355 TaxID=2975957 RepID=UPI002E27417F
MTPGALPLPVSFALAVRGYDREQVDEHLAELHDEIRLLTLDRDAAIAEAETLLRRLETARGEADDLRARLNRLALAPADPDAVGERVRLMLECARAEADAIIASARHRAAAVRERAAEAERRTAARLRAIDDFLARAEDILAEERPQPPLRQAGLTAA